MRRRSLLRSAVGTVLVAPWVARAGVAQTLNFIPVADVTSLDPVFTAPDVTAMHGHLVWDTLYGVDEQLTPSPQMVEGHSVEDDGLRWRLTLRPGLLFHDGEPVRARDVVASLRRWAAIDVFGAKLMQTTDELSAVSDRVVQFRLKRPFPLLPSALAKVATYSPLIMPQRIVEAAGRGPVSEIIGSGPFRYLADERVVGSRVVYGKFDGYMPRDEPGSMTAGGKRVYFDRVVWNIIPDPSTAAGMLQKGEADWWDGVPPDLAGLMRRAPKVTVAVNDLIGGEPVMRFNALHPPFDNPAVRRAILPAIRQSDYMTAIAGEERGVWRDRVGVWSVGKPMSTDAGVEVMAGDIEAAKRALAASGYRNERVVVLAAADYATLYSIALVATDMLRRIGLNVDLQTIDYGTQTQRRVSRAAPDQGGWSIFFTWFNGTNRYDPAAHLGITSSWPGWPKIAEIEVLREQWFVAPDLAAQREIARQIQLLVWRDAPYIPLGSYYTLAAYDRRLVGVSRASPFFFNVRRG
jgi:peptide/nickel transport system substrate-binding protein